MTTLSKSAIDELVSIANTDSKDSKYALALLAIDDIDPEMWGENHD